MPTAPSCATHGLLSLGPCPRCGTFVCRHCVVEGEGLTCSSCRAQGSTLTPWERRETLGVFGAYWATLRALLVTPTQFFSTMNPQGSMSSAFTLALLSTVLSAPFVFLAQCLQHRLLRTAVETMVKSMRLEETGPLLDRILAVETVEFASASTALSLTMQPVMLVLGAGLCHLGLTLWGAHRQGFRATFRAYAYVSVLAPGIAAFAMVPGIGGLVGFASIVYDIYGIAGLQRVGMGRAALGVMTMPLVMGCVMLFVVFGAYAYVAMQLAGVGR